MAVSMFSQILALSTIIWFRDGRLPGPITCPSLGIFKLALEIITLCPSDGEAEDMTLRASSGLFASHVEEAGLKP